MPYSGWPSHRRRSACGGTRCAASFPRMPNTVCAPRAPPWKASFAPAPWSGSSSGTLDSAAATHQGWSACGRRLHATWSRRTAHSASCPLRLPTSKPPKPSTRRLLAAFLNETTDEVLCVLLEDIVNLVQNRVDVITQLL